MQQCWRWRCLPNNETRLVGLRWQGALHSRHFKELLGVLPIRLETTLALPTNVPMDFWDCLYLEVLPGLSGVGEVLAHSERGLWNEIEGENRIININNLLGLSGERLGVKIAYVLPLKFALGQKEETHQQNGRKSQENAGTVLGQSRDNPVKILFLCFLVLGSFLALRKGVNAI